MQISAERRCFCDFFLRFEHTLNFSLFYFDKEKVVVMAPILRQDKNMSFFVIFAVFSINKMLIFK